MYKRYILLLVAGLMTVCAVSAQISVMGNLTRSRTAASGEEYEGVIGLKNSGDSVAQAKVYLKDYTFSSDGKTGYLDPGSLPRSNAGWITLSSSTAVLAPGEVAEIKYKVNIPASDSLFGTYWSIIFVEGIPEEEEKTREDVPLITIRQVLRYGVQIVTEFSDPGESRLVFSDTKILRTEEGRFFTVDIANSGTRWLNGELYVEVYSSEGEYVTTLTGGQFRTYPQTSVREIFNLEGLESGSYKALLIADCGGDDLFGGNYTLVIQE